MPSYASDALHQTPQWHDHIEDEPMYPIPGIQTGGVSNNHSARYTEDPKTRSGCAWNLNVITSGLNVFWTNKHELNSNRVNLNHFKTDKKESTKALSFLTRKVEQALKDHNHGDVAEFSLKINKHKRVIKRANVQIPVMTAENDLLKTLPPELPFNEAKFDHLMKESSRKNAPTQHSTHHVKPSDQRA